MVGILYKFDEENKTSPTSTPSHNSAPSFTSALTGEFFSINLDISLDSLEYRSSKVFKILNTI